MMNRRGPRTDPWGTPVVEPTEGGVGEANRGESTEKDGV